MTTAAATKRADLEVIHARQEAILNDATMTSNGNLTQDQRVEFDTLQNAYTVLSGCVSTASGGLRLPTKTARTDAGSPIESDHPTGSGGGLMSFGSRPPRGGSCSKLFGVSQPTNSGFKNLEDMARSITLGDSTRLAVVGGQSGGVPSDGGYSVPEEFMFSMLDKSVESEIVRPRCRVEPMISDTKIIATYDDSSHAGGELFGGLKGQWVPEGGDIAIETAKMKQIRLQSKKLAFLTSSTNELLTDSPGFESGFTARMSEALSWNLDDAFLVSGTGAGQPRSIINDPATITVAKEAAQPAATVTYNNLCAMFARLHPGCMANSTWVINQSLIPQLMTLSIAIGTAGSHVPVMTETNGQLRILTRPVVFSEKLPALGSLGDVLLADFSQYCVGLVRGGMRIDKSQHVRFSTDETVWRTVVRVDGMGTWAKAFTPKSGSTLSPFVTLAARA